MLLQKFNTINMKYRIEKRFIEKVHNNTFYEYRRSHKNS